MKPTCLRLVFSLEVKAKLDAIQVGSVTRRQMIYLLGAIFSLIIADGVVTNFLINYGIGREWNPLLLGFVGGNAFLWIKLFGSLLVMLIVFDIYKRMVELASVLVVCGVSVYTVIVYWNLSVLLFSDFWV